MPCARPTARCTFATRAARNSAVTCCFVIGFASRPKPRAVRSTKRRLARRDWPTLADYAAAKSQVVAVIIARAEGAKKTRAPQPEARVCTLDPVSCQADGESSIVYAPVSDTRARVLGQTPGGVPVPGQPERPTQALRLAAPSLADRRWRVCWCPHERDPGFSGAGDTAFTGCQQSYQARNSVPGPPIRREDRMTAEIPISVRELDCRSHGGVQIRLLWSEQDGRLWVAVMNTKDGRIALPRSSRWRTAARRVPSPLRLRCSPRHGKPPEVGGRPTRQLHHSRVGLPEYRPLSVPRLLTLEPDSA